MSEARDLTHREDPGKVVALEPGNLMDALIRVASDPSTDVEKMTQMMGLYERLTDRSAKQVYNAAMNAAQEEMDPVRADANNPQTKSRYASYAKLDSAVRPIYTKHGFGLSFDTADGAPADHIRVVCKVSHADGHEEYPHLDMPADGKGAKGGDVMTKTHAIGAAVTYGKRYLLGMIFNIAVGDVEEDGNSNGGRGREMGEPARRAIEDINACETAADLALWKKNKAEGVGNVVSADEMKVVITTYNRRVEAIKNRGAGDAA